MVSPSFRSTITSRLDPRKLKDGRESEQGTQALLQKLKHYSVLNCRNHKVTGGARPFGGGLEET